jgi:hypothetical protein
MVDTIHIYTDDPSIVGSFDLNLLEKCVEHHKETGTYFSGRIDNFNVSYSERRLWIKGSLTKFYFGNNVQNMNRQQLFESLKKLAAKLGLDICNFRISRIDIGVTLEMENLVQQYLENLIEVPRYKVRTYEGESKLFINKSKTISFYDKIEEIKQKNVNVQLSQLPISKNLLRYELQIKKANNVLGRITVNDLYDDKFLKKLRILLKDHFTKIKKKRKLIDIDKIIIKKPKDFLGLLACDKICDFGKEEVFSLLSKLCKNSKIDRRRKYDLKHQIDMIEQKFCRTSKYIEEFENKITKFVEGCF